MSITKFGKLRRTLAALCISCTILTCFIGSMTVSAKSITKLTASTVSAERGSIVSVAVTLNGNPGVWGMKFKVGYDHSALTLSSVTNGNIFTDDDVTLPETLAKEQFVYYACSNDLKDIKTNGTVVTLKFKVSENASFSAYPITVSLTQAINVSGKNINIDTQNGTITVVKCVHNKIWRATKAAGCETEGTETEACSKCGEVFSTRSIKATGHKNTEVKNAAAATVTSEGYTGDIYCKDCGELLSKGKTIAKLACVHNKVWRTTKAPGCETEGTETKICSKCGETFSTRSIKATGHQNTEVKNTVAATVTSEGYTGDTYCKDCGELLSKGKAIAKLTDKNSVTKPDQTKTPNQTPAQTTPDAATPDIIQGNEAVFDKASNGQLVFVSSADFSTFVRVEIDGNTLEQKNYTVASGSTVVTISGEYLSTLTDGQHTIAIVSKGGTATAVFTVKSEQKPSGGTTTNEVTKPDDTKTPAQATPNTLKTAIIFIIVVLCTGSLAFIIIKRRRK